MELLDSGKKLEETRKNDAMYQFGKGTTIPFFCILGFSHRGETRCDDDNIQFEDGGLLLGGFRTGTNR